MNKKIFAVLSLLVIGAMLLAACAPAAEPTPEPQAAPAEETVATDVPAAPEPTATEVPAVEEPAPAERTPVRWFVGLGAGSDEGTFEAQTAFVEGFNASQDKIELILEIVDNDVAYDTLATQIAAGNAPDIVGPVGIRGRDSFKGAWLDLQPYIDAESYDLSDFDPNVVRFLAVEGEGQLGIPFAIYPSFIVYNKDLFDEAGLPYPPTAYGDPYIDAEGTEHVWDVETIKWLGQRLTVDANGNDATSPDFDNTQIVQFGYLDQFTDPRGIGTLFGAGSLVDADGNAQVPDNWRAGWNWTYDGMWKDWFIPNGPYGGAEFLQGGGGPFSSGNMGMIHIHSWFVAPWGLGNIPNWDLAPTPAYNGVTTAKMHADTFGILQGAANPDAAWEVLKYMVSEEHATELLLIYGGMPARFSLQGTYFETYAANNFPGMTINWDIIPASMAYADNPNHESWMPSFQETTDRYNEFWNYIANTPDVDVNAEIDKLIVDLQAIFDAAK